MTIRQQLEQINFAENLPAFKKLKFLLGEKYETGSDYDEKTLSTPLGILMGETPCSPCGGRGWNIYNTSPDGDKDVCHECWGSGFEGLDHDDVKEWQFKRGLI